MRSWVGCAGWRPGCTNWANGKRRSKRRPGNRAFPDCTNDWTKRARTESGTSTGRWPGFPRGIAGFVNPAGTTIPSNDRRPSRGPCCAWTVRVNGRMPPGPFPERGSLSPKIGLPVVPRPEPSGQGVGAVYEYLRIDGRVDAEDLILDEIDGRLTLDGGLRGRVQHQVLLQVLTRVFGYASVVDRLEVGERDAEEEQRPISGILGERSIEGSALEGRSGFD